MGGRTNGAGGGGSAPPEVAQAPREAADVRDDFPRPVVEALAKRVAGCCSNPECRRPTSGPGTDPAKAVNLGVAAHITAASPGGPRYDPALSRDERRSAANGIWLCQVCAKLVDSDETVYPAELLRRWKADAERKAVRARAARGRAWLERAAAAAGVRRDDGAPRPTASALLAALVEHVPDVRRPVAEALERTKDKPTVLGFDPSLSSALLIIVVVAILGRRVSFKEVTEVTRTEGEVTNVARTEREFTTEATGIADLLGLLKELLPFTEEDEA